MHCTSRVTAQADMQSVQGTADAKRLLLQLRQAFQALPAYKREALKDALREGIATLDIEEHEPGRMRSRIV